MDEQRETVSSVTVLYCYAHEDKGLCEELEKHLSLLQREGIIATWYDRQIFAGTEWAQEIDEHLEAASIILLLISADFLASNYCYNIEMKRALERHQRGEARVIPIILRACDWRSSPFARLQCLPPDAQPVTKSPGHDEAWLAVVTGIRTTIKKQQRPRLTPDHRPIGSTPLGLPTRSIGVPHSGTKHRLLRVIALVLFIVLLVVPLVNHIFGIFPSTHDAATSATVMITPTSKDMKNTYTILAVMGTADASKHQVQARQLSYTTPSQSHTVLATGIDATQGTQAKGTVTFWNDDSTSHEVSAGTVLSNALRSPIRMQVDQTVIVPAAHGGFSGTNSASAHIVEKGVNGNIPPFIDGSTQGFQSSCCGPQLWGGVQNNSAFSGGANPQSYTVVQQSNIADAANVLPPDPGHVLQTQIHSNEQLIGTSQCNPNAKPDHAVGDRATSVTVTVSFTCTGEVYDNDGALTMAAQWLKQDAAQKFSTHYALIGNVVPTQTQVRVTDVSSGTISVSINAEGLWVYQFNDAQMRELTKSIAGKRRQDALTLLSRQDGVNRSDIRISGGDGNPLPTDTSRIKIEIQV